MTLTEIQTAISTRSDYSGTAIPASSSEWSRRLALINQAEDTVKNFLNKQWSFLLTSASLNTTANQAYVTLPADYERGATAGSPNNQLTINTLDYTVRNYINTLNYDSTDQFAWITGNNSQGYKLYIQPTPGGVYPFTFNYYTNQMATSTSGTGKAKLALIDDITKIPDPYFIVDWVVGELFLIDDETANKWQSYKESAQNRLVTMAAMDGRDQNQQFYIPVGDEEDGYDIFNSDGNDD